MKFWGWGIFIIGIVVIVWVSYCNEIVFKDLITYEGLWVSVYGVILTLIQVLQLKKTTEATEEAVIATRKQMDLILSISDISKHVVNLRFVKECVTNGKMELARLRLSDVKDFMSKIGYITDLTYDKNTYKRLVNSIEANMNSLEIEINSNQPVDRNVLSKDLESVASFLIDVENKLKSK